MRQKCNNKVKMCNNYETVGHSKMNIQIFSGMELWGEKTVVHCLYTRYMELGSVLANVRATTCYPLVMTE
jgi:hypothetical protein